MPQVSTHDKIMKCARKLNISAKSLEFLNALVNDSKNSIVDNFSNIRNGYIFRIFKGDEIEYLKALEELYLNRFINYNTVQDKVTVLALLSHHLNNLLYGFKPKLKKKYVRKPVKQQQSIMEVLTSGKLGQIVKTALIKAAHNVAEISFKYKDRGFKVPESIMPYFTGLPLTDQEREVMLRYNPEQVVLEEKRRNMPKNSILAYCACLAFIDDNGIIEDCTEHSLLHNVLNEFGNIFCVQTWYNSIDRLLELKLIEKFYDKEKDCPCIRVTGIKESLSDRYVIIPFIVFGKDFKRVETAGMKMFFDIMFGLNNGEEKRSDGTIKVVGQGKTFFFKMAKLDAEREENREKFLRKLLQYKKRYPNELRIAMFGDAAKSSAKDPNDSKPDGPPGAAVKESEFRALAKYFHFHYTSGTALMIRIRKEYYISKESEKTKKQLAHIRHKRKMQLLKDLLKNHNIEYQEQDMLDLIKVFSRVNRRTISLIISILAERVRLIKEYGWSQIKSLGAYSRKILQEHQRGDIDPDKFVPY